MDDSQLQKVQGWFETLNRKVDDLVTKQQFENRFQALLNAIANLHERVESYKNQQDAEIVILKRALHDLEEEIKHLRNEH